MARGGTTTKGDVMDCYPGDDYVDIVAVDWYPGKSSLENLTNIANAYEDLTGKTGKIFVYGELGVGDDVVSIGDNYTFTAEDYANMLKRFTEIGVKSAYTLAWFGWNTVDGRYRLSIYDMGKGKEFYENNPGFLDKEDTRELLYD